MGKLKAGASHIDITPDLPVSLGGVFLSYETDRVIDALLASSLSVTDGDNTTIIISVDMSLVTEETSKEIRDRINQKTGVDQKHIIVCATHNHSGPFTLIHTVFRSKQQLEKDRLVIDKIIEKTVLCAHKAFDNMREAKMGYGSGTAQRCCFNRRYIMSNGRAQLNPVGVDRTDRLMVEGPVDEQVQTVWFEDHQGNIISVLVNLSTHSAMFYGQEYITADFPGSMRKTVWGALGEKFPILYLQGSSGNIITFDFEHDDQWGKGLDGYKHIGRILAGEVIKLISLTRAESTDSGISHLSRTIDIPFRDYGSDEIKTAMMLYKESLDRTDSVEFFNDRLKTLEEKALFFSITGIEKMKSQHKDKPVEINAIRLGDVVIVTNPAELFVEYQLEIKKKFKDRKIIVAELTNGWTSYIPTRQAIALGGYEVKIRHLVDEAGSLITQNSIELIKEVFNRA